MPPSATNSSLTDLARADQADAEIEFAEFTEDVQQEPLDHPELPAAAAPSWFKMRARSKDEAPTPDVSTAADAKVAEPEVSSPVLEPPAARTIRQKQSSKPKRTTRTDDGIRTTTNESARHTSKSAKNKRSSTASQSQDDSEEKPQPSFWANWRQYLRRAVLGAYGTSLLFHVLTLLALSVIVINQHQPPEALTTTLSEADGAPEAFDGLVELSLPKAGAELSKAPLLTPIAVSYTHLTLPTKA